MRSVILKKDSSSSTRTVKLLLRGKEPIFGKKVTYAPDSDYVAVLDEKLKDDNWPSITLQGHIREGNANRKTP